MASLQQPNQPVVAAASTSVASLAPPKLFKPASLKPQLLAPLPSLDSLPVSLPQVNKAVHALLTHIGKRQEKAASSSSLLLGEREEKVYLVCGLKRSANREIHKPIQLCVSSCSSPSSSRFLARCLCGENGAETRSGFFFFLFFG